MKNKDIKKRDSRNGVSFLIKGVRNNMKHLETTLCLPPLFIVCAF